jgi:hypothetical protein
MSRCVSGILELNSAFELDGVLERNRDVSEFVEVRSTASRDDLAGGHLVFRTVHTVDGDQLAVTQITGAEAPRRRISPGYNCVVTVANPNDDHLQVVLIRPEPGYLVMYGGRANKVERGSSSLFESVVD